MARRKKRLKERGDSVIIRTKQDEPSYIMDWLNNQSNISEAFRYLIKKDVMTYGLRDLKDEIINQYPVQVGQHSTSSNSNSVMREQQFESPNRVSPLNSKKQQVNEEITTNPKIEKSPSKIDNKTISGKSEEDKTNNYELENQDESVKESTQRGMRKPVRDRNINLGTWSS
ncbi:hypothetical protein [Sutcliffiella cohnii]|uniref:hypothetical protein n=1 Tax=Sutcliffiella cohnii TaxID=33932 RepID=UPI00082F7119|nr:hypothetical protein [Sutcliffiella cohnii]